MCLLRLVPSYPEGLAYLPAAFCRSEFSSNIGAFMLKTFLYFHGESKQSLHVQNNSSTPINVFPLSKSNDFAVTQGRLASQKPHSPHYMCLHPKTIHNNFHPVTEWQSFAWMSFKCRETMQLGEAELETAKLPKTPKYET